MANRVKIVDTDAHFQEDLAEVAKYMPQPWKRRLVEGGEIGQKKFFGNSTGDRFVWGRIQREHTSYQEGPMGLEDITKGMEFLDIDATVQISQLVLALSRLTADDDRVSAFASGYVDFMLDRIVDPSEGIYTVIPIPYSAPQDAVDLIERAADEKAIVAGCMVTAGANPPLGNEKYNPIYEAAERKELPLIFHTGGSGLDSFKNQGYEKFIETHTLGFLEGNMSQLTSLVIQGIPEKYPDLDVVFQESGVFWVPMMMHRLDEEYLKRPSEAPLLEKRPSEYMREFYYGTQPFECSGNQRFLEMTIEMLGGPQRLMYASDYPHWDFDRPTAILDRDFLSSAEKEQILSGNAKEVFGI